MDFKGSKKIKEIADTYGVDLLVLFGSRTDDSARPESDVDIAYAKAEPLSFDDEQKLGNEMGALFFTDAVDVVYLNKTSPIFMFEIMKKAKQLFARTPLLFPNFFSYAIKRLRENMFLYDLKFSRLCTEYKVK